MHVKSELEKISGNTITDEAHTRDAIKVMNRSRKARREFVKLAGRRPPRRSPLWSVPLCSAPLGSWSPPSTLRNWKS